MVGKYSGWNYNIEEHECRRIHNPELYHPILLLTNRLPKKASMVPQLNARLEEKVKMN